jgi:hypothetical protein
MSFSFYFVLRWPNLLDIFLDEVDSLRAKNMKVVVPRACATRESTLMRFIQTGKAALSNSRAARISKDSIGTHNSYNASPAP